ncbi:unnamed protein product, partial [Heterotrigona itama]
MTSIIVVEVVVGNRRQTRSSRRRLFGSPATEPRNLATRRSKGDDYPYREFRHIVILFRTAILRGVGDRSHLLRLSGIFKLAEHTDDRIILLPYLE